MADPPPDGALGRILAMTCSIKARGDQVRIMSYHRLSGTPLIIAVKIKRKSPGVDISGLTDLVGQLELLVSDQHCRPPVSIALDDLLG